MAKRPHSKSVAAGDELDPVFDSLAPVVALTHAPWNPWMPQAAMAICVKAALNEHRDSARPWTAV